jgi:hypothetical protein
MAGADGHLYCLRCRTVAIEGEKRCVACGARFRPLPYRGFVYLVLLGTLTAVLIVGVVGLWASAKDQGDAEKVRDATPRAPRTTLAATTTAPPQTAPPATTAPAAPQIIRSAVVEASGQSGRSTNNCGDVTSYEPEKVLDGDPTTGWRVKGDGTGQSLVFTFAGPTKLTSVGLLPGYAKTDPCSASDRFKQLRRITKVTWTFDQGPPVEQTFEEKPEIQSMPVDVTTTRVTLQIDGVTAKPVIDATPISEVQFVGVPAA